MLFLSGWDSGLVFSRRVRYRLVWAFSIPVDSPRNQRGRSWSRNRGLRFEIRVDNGRFPEMVLCRGRLSRLSVWCPALQEAWRRVLLPVWRVFSFLPGPALAP